MAPKRAAKHAGREMKSWLWAETMKVCAARHCVRAQGARGFCRKAGVFTVDAQLVPVIDPAVNGGNFVAEALAELEGIAGQSVSGRRG
jgi:hypothetical protein